MNCACCGAEFSAERHGRIERDEFDPARVDHADLCPACGISTPDVLTWNECRDAVVIRDLLLRTNPNAPPTTSGLTAEQQARVEAERKK